MCTPFEDGTIRRREDNLGERGRIARTERLIVVRSGDHERPQIGFERLRRRVGLAADDRAVTKLNIHGRIMTRRPSGRRLRERYGVTPDAGATPEAGGGL